ncbi:MAG: type I glyceraldehyde-3-phosphate dehydrogenase [Desulfohalobiaceae bacterium]|nr:type I glyceraldehyde-3-phosphate dehydrogenase [Desulfohalobiaceae bacterium]
MAKIKIGINGFGRIGRQVTRAMYDRYPEQVELVAVNDLFDAGKNAGLLKYDTSYGRFKESVQTEGEHIRIGNWRVRNFSETDPRRIPWGDLGVDVVVESTGIFRTGPAAGAHIEGGAKKVIITAPAKQVDKTLVLGVNESTYDPQNDHIVSNASCTTNCLAPVALVVHRNFGIEKGTMCTVHAYTNDQRILDLPHKDPRRARAAGGNIIPTTTGAAEAVGLVIPELKGRIQGYAMRVPVPTVSVVDFTALINDHTTLDILNEKLQAAARSELKGILDYCEEPLVSSDFIGDPHSAIVDPAFNKIQGGNLVTIMAWYDNEWGYACRVADLAALMLKQQAA